MKEIVLTQGKKALVDDKDFKWLNQWKWSFDGHYAQRVKNRKHIRMHTLILDTPKGMQGDHKNSNRLDNQRHNLRNVKPFENNLNRSSEKNSTSKFKGIHWHKASNKWKVEIGFRGKNIYIGTFKNEIHAALAYDIWARDLHKQFAKTNFESVCGKILTEVGKR